MGNPRTKSVEPSSRDFFCRFRGENRNYSVVLGVKIRNYSVVLGRENRNYSIFFCRFGVDVSPTLHSRLFQKREKLHFSNTFAPDFYIFPTRLSPNFTFFQHVCANNPPIIRIFRRCRVLPRVRPQHVYVSGVFVAQSPPL